MEFAITFKPDMTPARIVNLTRQAEAAGFNYGWMFDSHVLWQEPFPLMTLMAANTQKMRIGPCVTNPAVRDWSVTASLFATLNRISGGRMDIGIGRGDSSRRVMGKRPTTLAVLEECVQTIRDLSAGKQITYEEKEIQMPWADGGVPPIWVAGYGPKALRCAGKIGDGVILQFADPHLIKWCLNFVREGAEEAGRDFSKIKVMSAAPVWVSDDLAAAREHVRWFPALVSNHVVDLVSKYKPEELPEELTAFIRDRKGYNYLHHAEVGSSNAEFVTDEVVDRFCIVGPVKEQVRKLKELAAVGVTQFNIYLMCGDEEQTVEIYGNEVIPAYH
ncbi:MAG TPA: TIGR03842 family LLM class F420-dependent oxidoreductase [Blastocatellia bacterium]|nr:TIGR03842 family LLM class F420-dependent oxidoreductase [Blastocatellia bacterium]HMV82985.1 TIGR03842 family LLM class F420-dependent oxidoreductase [Blastocatellia bacterium]HMX28077.1 TIGR03842 family LLM class F420-dependent oxidoreductase [Blastocatellia bacterium]HMY72167.1 TIGR03842 family LLM class F420-dependent oxidoreductase [Blastocatellia bacterium]HMZ19760.1 TIGR03842 family LLM class F420-dependent oxidoreductase [Blastocatellia bacterium]